MNTQFSQFKLRKLDRLKNALVQLCYTQGLTQGYTKEERTKIL